MFESFLGNMASGGMGIIGSALNFAQNVGLAELQNKYNIDMWNRNNEYNSPQAQMQRFKDAGLNPNLIYSQGSPGLSSAPPQMHAPQPVEMSKPMQELGKAFNIENLKTLIANRKKAEAEADNANTDAVRNKRVLHAERNIGLNWSYDYDQGKYVPRNLNEVNVIDPSAYYANRILEGNYNKSHLIPFRAGLLDYQKRYLVPQVQMLHFEREKQPVTYWVNTVGKGVRTAADAVGIFSPKNWFVPRTSFNPYNY